MFKRSIYPAEDWRDLLRYTCRINKADFERTLAKGREAPSVKARRQAVLLFWVLHSDLPACSLSRHLKLDRSSIYHGILRELGYEDGIRNGKEGAAKLIAAELWRPDPETGNRTRYTALLERARRVVQAERDARALRARDHGSLAA